MRVAQERVATRMEQKTEVRQEVPAGARTARGARAAARRVLVRAPTPRLTHSSLRETARRRGESCA
jgi:hypothetical protein